MDKKENRPGGIDPFYWGKNNENGEDPFFWVKDNENGTDPFYWVVGQVEEDGKSKVHIVEDSRLAGTVLPAGIENADEFLMCLSKHMDSACREKEAEALGTTAGCEMGWVGAAKETDRLSNFNLSGSNSPQLCCATN